MENGINLKVVDFKRVALVVTGIEEVVGATGFEPATSWSQTKCSTRLSYAPSTRGLSSQKFSKKQPVN